MRYQSPIANPLSQYWEEEYIFTGSNRIWKELLLRLKYYAGEYVLANVILTMSIIIQAVSLRPAVARVQSFYQVYGVTWGFKRGLDIVASLIGLIAISPILLIVAILIKLDSPGPVYFRQERIGKNRRRSDRRVMSLDNHPNARTNDRRQKSGYGRPFMIVKFRTMRNNAEKETGPVWAQKNDPRITKLGAILRATRIDELPQMINIFKGEMSIVGPRPEREFFIHDLRQKINDYERRLLVRPGLTGLAQVKHKYDECIKDTQTKVRYDLEYIAGLNIIRDIKIILQTVYVVLAAKGM